MSTDQPFEPAPPTPPAAPAAGWYPDPADAAMQRYWDGAAWTSTTHPLVTAPPAWQSTAAPAAAPLYGTAGYAAPAYPAQGWRAGLAPPVWRAAAQGRLRRRCRAFAGWKDYSGRATVAEYWWFYLFQMVVFLVPYVILLVLLPSRSCRRRLHRSSTRPRNRTARWSQCSWSHDPVRAGDRAVPGAPALTIRRLHDTDRVGWWYFISFVPFEACAARLHGHGGHARRTATPCPHLTLPVLAVEAAGHEAVAEGEHLAVVPR
jgi:hypothetical protein